MKGAGCWALVCLLSLIAGLAKGVSTAEVLAENVAKRLGKKRPAWLGAGRTAVTVEIDNVTAAACGSNCVVEALDSSGNVLGRGLVGSSNVAIVTVTKVPLYVRVSIGNKGGEALAVVSNCADTVYVNALTTVACSYTLAFLLSGASSSKWVLGAAYSRSAVAMYGNLIDVESGGMSSVLQTSPNADQTNGMRVLNSLGNLVAGTEFGKHGALLDILAVDDYAPETLGAALGVLARNPSTKVETIYALVTEVIDPAYTPALESAPRSWLLVLKVNDSGDKSSRLIGGPAKLVFDPDTGVAWVTNNVEQGTQHSGDFCFALDASGKPVDFSPFTGNHLLGAGYGVAMNGGQVFFGNFGWGVDTTCKNYPGPDCTGSLSVIDARTGQALEGSPYQIGDRVQGLNFDESGNLWGASMGNDQVFVLLGADTSKILTYTLYSKAQPFDVQIFGDSAWVTSGGGFQGTDANSTLSQFRINDNRTELELVQQVAFGEAIKGFDVDSMGNIWVASQSESSIYKVSQNAQVVSVMKDGGINGPWSTTVDGEDNIWISNFGPLATGEYQPRISKLKAYTGEAMSPDGTGWIVENSGDPILLANGDPLLGSNWLGEHHQSYQPLMRVTYTAIDAAGNAWIINNWKLSVADNKVNDPGGDGIVIAVGVAAPLEGKKSELRRHRSKISRRKMGVSIL